MERISEKRYEGFECINSDLSMTIYGGKGSIWLEILSLLIKFKDFFIKGFLDGWSENDESYTF